MTRLSDGRFSRNLSLLWLTCKYGLPGFGKLRRLARHGAEPGSNSQREIFGDFYSLWPPVNDGGIHFEACQSYLRKVHEGGRNVLSTLSCVLIGALVLLEAAGFSYLLAGFTIPGASENVQRIGAIGIAFLVSAILVILTHWTGRELHKNSLVKKARWWWSQDQTDDKARSLVPNTEVSLDSDVDGGDKPYIQLLSRIDANATVTPTYATSIATVLFVVIVSIGASYVRLQVLEQEIAQDAMMHTVDEPGINDPYSTLTPSPTPDIVNPLAEAYSERQRRGGRATFVVLGVLFCFLQVVGVLIGSRTGFAGKESKQARRYIGSFGNVQEFNHAQDRERAAVARAAQAKLEELRQMVSKFATTAGPDALDEKTFYAFVAEQEKFQRAHSEERQSEEQVATTVPESAGAARAPAHGIDNTGGEYFAPTRTEGREIGLELTKSREMDSDEEDAGKVRMVRH